MIQVEFTSEFHPGWNKIAGVSVTGKNVRIDIGEYFFRYENPSWLVCDWTGVRDELLNAIETEATAVEQMALDHIREHGRTTDDPGDVLKIAEETTSFLFRDELLSEPGLVQLGVKARHLRMLREVGTLMALNRVELSGKISNVGPAWMFPVACKVVYGLEETEARLVDELYHGTWFDERRRVEAVKANAALGGKLVHGCQSQVDMRGGAVVPFGVDLTEFRRELRHFGDDWIERVEACDR
ncbi:hypothetical protein E1293_44450 [Actinomadura darangshiensis]|uniref:Uncharacterized protein n=2 Tax=Actinomadura darangshiensis TaxID=705336 RepID=A0A4R4ZUV1_9ACTN|nr:hypothetical protein E1293_44450 [Actinomadura darangshiensis]